MNCKEQVANMMPWHSFERVLEDRLGMIRSTLATKGIEYTTSKADRFENFRRAGQALGCTPERALIGFWMKHVVSILQIVDRIDRKEFVPAAMFSEKICDTINYMILLEGLLEERLTVKETEKVAKSGGNE